MEFGIAANNVYRLVEPFEAAGLPTEFTDRQWNRAWRILSAPDLSRPARVDAAGELMASGSVVIT